MSVLFLSNEKFDGQEIETYSRKVKATMAAAAQAQFFGTSYFNPLFALRE